MTSTIFTRRAMLSGGTLPGLGLYSYFLFYFSDK